MPIPIDRTLLIYYDIGSCFAIEIVGGISWWTIESAQDLLCFIRYLLCMVLQHISFEDTNITKLCIMILMILAHQQLYFKIF